MVRCTPISVAVLFWASGSAADVVAEDVVVPETGRFSSVSGMVIHGDTAFFAGESKYYDSFDVFVAAGGPRGLTWRKFFGTTMYYTGLRETHAQIDWAPNAITVDEIRNVYVVGRSGGPFTRTYRSDEDTVNPYIMKLSPYSGRLSWERRLTMNVEGHEGLILEWDPEVVVPVKNGVLVAGGYSGVAQKPGGSVLVLNVKDKRLGSVLALINNAGAVEWAKSNSESLWGGLALNDSNAFLAGPERGDCSPSIPADICRGGGSHTILLSTVEVGGTWQQTWRLPLPESLRSRESSTDVTCVTLTPSGDAILGLSSCHLLRVSLGAISEENETGTVTWTALQLGRQCALLLTTNDIGEIFVMSAPHAIRYNPDSIHKFSAADVLQWTWRVPRGRHLEQMSWSPQGSLWVAGGVQGSDKVFLSRLVTTSTTTVVATTSERVVSGAPKEVPARVWAICVVPVAFCHGSTLS